MTLTPQQVVKDNGEAPSLETDVAMMHLSSRQTAKDKGNVSSLEMEAMAPIYPHQMSKDDGDGPSS